MSDRAIEIVTGTVLNRMWPDATLDPGYPGSGAVRIRIDTQTDVEDHRSVGDICRRVTLSRPFASRFKLAELDAAYEEHRWQAFAARARLVLTADGADTMHTAFIGMCERRTEIQHAVEEARARATKRWTGPRHLLMETSLVSSTGHASAMLLPALVQQPADLGDKADDVSFDLVAMIHGPTDGAGTYLNDTRRAGAYAALLAIDAMAVAAASESIRLPGDVGALRKAPYGTVYIASHLALHAEKLTEFALATKFLSVSLADRTPGGLGASVGAEGPTRSLPGVRVSRKHGKEWKRSSRFAVPCIEKVTLDRAALADRAAQFATRTFLTNVRSKRTVTNDTFKTLSDLLVTSESQVLDQIKKDYAPKEQDLVELQWTAPNFSRDEIARLWSAQRGLTADRIQKWRIEGLPAAKRGLEDLFARILVERVAMGQLISLPEEFRLMAKGFADWADALTANAKKADGDLAKLTSAFREAKLDRHHPGATEAHLIQAAQEHATAAFKRECYPDLADEIRKYAAQAVRRAEQFGRPFLEEVDFQMSERGMYQITLTDPRLWETLRHPAPNILRLHFEPGQFESLYFEADILEGRDASGLHLREEQAREAARNVAPVLASALSAGAAAFGAVAKACEDHFRGLYAAAWRTQHLSSARDISGPFGLRAALDEANKRVRSFHAFIAHHDAAKAEVAHFAEFPEDDPAFAALVDDVQRLGAFKECSRTRADESAIVLMGVARNLDIDEVFERDGEERRLLLERLRSFQQDEPQSQPVFASRWFEDQVRKCDPDVDEACTPHRPAGEAVVSITSPVEGQGVWAGATLAVTGTVSPATTFNPTKEGTTAKIGSRALGHPDAIIFNPNTGEFSATFVVPEIEPLGRSTLSVSLTDVHGSQRVGRVDVAVGPQRRRPTGTTATETQTRVTE